MEVLLIKQLKNLGKVGDLIEVAPGFARNFLLPQKIAVYATAENKRQFEEKRHELEAKNLELRKNAEDLSRLLHEKELNFFRNSAADGKLFGSVSAKEIAQMLNQLESNLNLKVTQILLNHPIKTMGTTSVTIELHPEVYTSVLVTIARNDEEAAFYIDSYKKKRDKEDKNAEKEDKHTADISQESEEES